MNNERNSRSVAIDVVEKAREAIRKQPKASVKRMSLRSAVNDMYDDIMLMMTNGHDWSAVVKVLKENDIDIKMATLRSYVYAIKNNPDNKLKGKAKK